MVQSRDTVPAPFIVAPTGDFDGSDGNWSTFALEIGTTIPQTFRILPATGLQEIWIPSPNGCASFLQGLSDCGTQRGINDYDGAPSRGFMTNASDSWSLLGTFQTSDPEGLYPNEPSAIYGLDTVALAQSRSSNYGNGIEDQTVALVDSVDFWLGSVGLGIRPGSFQGRSAPVQSLLYTMKNQSLVPSLSFGYTAGRSYSSPRTNGSLVLGGYDANRISTDSSKSASLPLSDGQLLLNISGLFAMQLPQSSVQQLAPTPLTMTIDSTVSQMWFPSSVCQLFAEAFGLKYDDSTNLYLVNSTNHAALKSSNPTLTFQLSGANDGDTFNIQMGYDAFDLAVGLPLYNDSTPYFPIRNASSESQYVLGRTFFQEAYIVVDWERQNFTIGQAQTSSTQDVRAILELSATTSATPSAVTSAASHSKTSASSGSKHGISGGAIGGIVVAVIVLLGIAAGVFFFMRRRKRTERSPAELEANSIAPPPGIDDYPTEKIPAKSDKTHMAEAPIYEMQGNSSFRPPSELASTPRNEPERIMLERELMGTPILEMVGSEAGSELDVSVSGSRTHSPRINPELRHSQYQSIDGSTMRLAELSSDTDSEFDGSELGSRPASPRVNSDRTRYMSVNGAVSRPLLEQDESADDAGHERPALVSPMHSGDEVPTVARMQSMQSNKGASPLGRSSMISPMQSGDEVNNIAKQQGLDLTPVQSHERVEASPELVALSRPTSLQVPGSEGAQDPHQ